MGVPYTAQTRWAITSYLHDLAVWWRWRPRFKWRLRQEVVWTSYMVVSNHTMTAILVDEKIPNEKLPWSNE